MILPQPPYSSLPPSPSLTSPLLNPPHPMMTGITTAKAIRMTPMVLRKIASSLILIYFSPSPVMTNCPVESSPLLLKYRLYT